MIVTAQQGHLGLSRRGDHVAVVFLGQREAGDHDSCFLGDLEFGKALFIAAIGPA